ncbi:MAG: phage portal protein [Armatimonadota bacterium]
MGLDLSKYPPPGHQERLNGYARFEKLFLGQHKLVFTVTPQPYQLKRYIAANFAGLISRLSADLLFGEEPDFVPAGEDEIAKDALKQIVTRNGLHALNYESALSNSFRGDAIYKARWGKRTPQAEAPEAIVEEVPASIYFPEFDEDDVRKVTRVTLAWTKRDPRDARKLYLRAEVHEPGIIRHQLFDMGSVSTLTVAGTNASVAVDGKQLQQVPLATLEAYAELPEEEETGLDHLPIFHVPNFRYGSRFWGISDYEGLESLFESLNNRVSQIDEVLDKHVAPKIVLPPGFVDRDGKVRFDRMETIELQPGDQPPSYITWDAHLTAAFAQFDKLLDLLFMLSETAPSAFGLDKFGIAESGRALRLRLLRTLAKINRKRLYYDTALKQALLTAQILDVTHGSGSYEPQQPTIQWSDGLPEDVVEMVEIESQRLAAGNTSVESSVRRLDGPDAVEAEMQRIAEEEKQLGTFTGARGRRGQEAFPPLLPPQEPALPADTRE